MSTPQIKWIDPLEGPEVFPNINQALDYPNGLLAVGGDLSLKRLISAYTKGIFPWFSEGQPILWWSPNPRCIIKPKNLHISKRLVRYLRKSNFSVTFNSNFSLIIKNCSMPRPNQKETWITEEMLEAYKNLHNNGWAHSIEIWESDDLVGGLYGLAIDKIFFGESMFSNKTNGSKAALLALCYVLRKNNFELLDCQIESPHLINMGAELINRERLKKDLKIYCSLIKKFQSWPKNKLPINHFQ